MDESFELIILVIERDLPILSQSIPYIRRFLGPRKIRVIAAADCLRKVAELGLIGEGDSLLDEDSVVPGLSLALVRSLIEKRGGNPRRAGWYFKQMTNLAYASRPDCSSFYLTWDADTIPVRKIRFFDEEGRSLLTRKGEYHKPYFETIERLLGLERQVDFSFIAEHMLFDRGIARELLGAMMGGQELEGGALAERIIGAVADKDLSISGFAEYETYGTFAHARHPDRIAARSLASMRHGTAFFGRSPSVAQLFTASTRYYWASFETWNLVSPLQRLKKLGAGVLGRLWLAFSLSVLRSRYLRFKEDMDAARN